MSYLVIKTIAGRRYRYLQTSYRVGKKVKTKSVYLGPASGAASIRIHDPKFDVEKELQRQKAERAKEQQALALFTREVGLKVGPANPIPIEKATGGLPTSYLSPASRSAPARTVVGENAQSTGSSVNAATPQSTEGNANDGPVSGGA
jgi:hypothetical protein